MTDIQRADTSFAQRSLWFADRAAPGDPLHHVVAAVHIHGRLDRPLLERALGMVIARHDVLRTVFELDGDQPVQVLLPELPLSVSVVDTAEAEVDATVREAVRELVRIRFDLERGPLLRTRLLGQGEDPDYHVAVLVMHRIIADEWSASLVLRELAECYEAVSAEREPRLDPLPIRYADYVASQSESLDAATTERLLGYWTERLADLPELRLPTDRPRPAERAARGSTFSFPLPDDILPTVERLAEQHRVSSFVVLLAVFQVLLAKYSGQQDIAVAVPVTNRDRPDVAGLVGRLANLVVMRTDLSGDLTFGDLLGRVRQTAEEAYAHQELSFERVREVLRPERHASPATSATRVRFVLQDVAPDGWKAGGLLFEPMAVDSGTAEYELALTLEPFDQGHRGRIEYDVDLFDESTVRASTTHYLSLLNAAAADPTLRVSELPMLDQAALSFADGMESPAAPRTHSEQVIAGVWADLLGVPAPPVNVNFFEIGGHSLAVMRLSAQLQQSFGLPVPVADLFDNVTIEAQAELVERLYEDSLADLTS